MSRFRFNFFIKILVVFTAVFLFSTCDNLFRIGMGDEVDLEPPSLSLVSPSTGSFVKGSIVFEGTVADDQQVSNVEISFDNGESWTAVEHDQTTWSFGYSTAEVNDGRLAVLIRATDAQEKITTSEEYLFSVDNTPPVVLITSPTNYDQLSFNTSLALTVAATDIYQLQGFNVAATAATIPDGFDTAADDPDSLTWEQLSGYPKTISQTASPLSYEFNSTSYTIDAGAPHRYFRFAFSASDEAGNLSSSFFHIDEVAAINDNLLLTVDQIADILDGRSYTNSQGTTITAADLNAIKRNVSTAPILLEFDEDTNLPRAGLSFPTSETADLPTMRSSDSLQGFFEDDDGIDTSTMLLMVEKASGYDSATQTADSWSETLNWSAPDSYQLNSEIGARRIDWSHPVTDFGQGVFRLTLDAQDVAGADRPSVSDYTEIFMISDGAPDLEITPPANLNFNDSIVLSGTASHSIAVTSVTLSVGTGTTANPVWIFEGLGADYDEGTSSWTFDSDLFDFGSVTPAGGLDNLPEGEILVRAIVNGETEKNIYLYKDITAPIVSFDRPEDGSQLNTNAVINGAADDARSGIYNVEVLISHPSNPLTPATADAGDWHSYLGGAVLGVDGYEFGPSVASWRYTFNTESYADDNLITFYIRGTDRAGNSQTESRTFHIFQDSDLPAISLTNVDVAGSRFDNVLAGEPFLVGSITDDDNVDPDTFSYRVRYPDDSWGDWVYPYSPGVKTPTSRLDFNIPVYEPGTASTALSEGSHEIQFWVEDVNGLGISRTAAESGGALDLAMSVDGNPPAINLTGPVSGSIYNDDFAVTASVADGFGIDSVQLSFDGGTTYESPVYEYVSGDPSNTYNLNYSVVLGTDIAGDGTYNIRVRALDLSGSSANENTTVIIDTTAPVISLDQPVEGDTVNDQVAVSGIVTESLQMDSAWYWTGLTGASAPDYDVPDPTVNGWIEFADPRNLSAEWDSYTEQSPVFTSQSYDVHVVVRDLAGNWGVLTPRTVTVNQESDRPVIEFTNVNSAAAGMPSPYGTAPVNLFGANAVLNGTVSDDDGVNGTDIYISTRSYDWDTGSWGSWSVWAAVSSPFSGNRTNGNWSHDISTLGEGVHQAMIRVLDEDFSGTLADTDTTADQPGLFEWNQTDAVEFSIDIDLPSLTIDSPVDGDYLNSSFSITGTAADSNRLLEYDPGSGLTDYILLLEGSGSDWSGASQVAVDTATDGWQYDVTVDAGGGDDGHKSWQVRAEDRMGRITTHDYDFTVDTTPPSTDITAFLPSVLVDDGFGDYDEHVNGIVQFDAAAGDENGIQRVKYWIQLSTAAAPTEATFDTGGTVITAPYIENIDTTSGYTDDTFYTLYVGSEDSAGNRSIISREIFIDQDSDLPSLTLTNLDESITTSGSAASNLLESNPRVSGTVSDDDWVDSSSLQISINGGAYEAVDTVGSSGTEISFTHQLSDEGDGVHYISFQVSDTNDGANDRKLGLGAVQTTSSTVYFAIDQSNPVVVITPPANTFTTGSFSMSGTATDGNNVSQVLASIDGGITYTADDFTSITGTGTSSASWSWTGDLSGEDEGPFTIKIKAVDEFNKEYIADLTVTVDHTGPGIGISTPNAAETVNGPVNISGSATETYGLSGVEIAIDRNEPDDDDDDVTISFAGGNDLDWTAAVGTYAWLYSLDSTAFADGTYTVYVRATDQAGNVTDPWESLSFEIEQSSDKPVIYLSTLEATGTATDNLLPGSLQISGTVNDDDSVESTSIQIRVDEDNNGTYSGIGREAWTDITGQPANDANVVTWSHTFTGMTDGQYSFEMRAGDINFGSDYTDIYKAVTLADVDFSIDTALPEGSVTYPAQGAYLTDPGDGTITITGDSSDASGIKSVEISIGGGAAVPVTGTTSWSYDYTIVTDGQVSYQIIITDNYDKVFTIDKYFTVDTTPPAPSFIQPGSGETINGSMLVRGTTDDANIVADVYFQLVSDGTIPTIPADPVSGDWAGNGWTNLSGTFSWSQRIDTTGYGDGLYDVYVYAVDNAGNVNAAPALLDDLDFDQDSNLPVITVNSMAAAPAVNLYGTGGVISGNITDDDSVDASTIEISFDGGSTWGAVSNQGSNGTSVNWSHDLDTAAESSTAYSVQIRASDIGDVANGIPVQTSTVPATPYVVAIDRALPSAAVNSIDFTNKYDASAVSITGADLSGALVNNNFSFTIGASDNNGIKEVAVAIEGSNYSTGGYTTTGVSDNGDGTWTYNVTVDVAGGSNDGTMSIDVRVIDTWDRPGTDNLNIYIDTTEPAIDFTVPSDITTLVTDDAPNVNGDVLIRGSVQDDDSGIDSVAVVGGTDTANNPINLAVTGTIVWNTTLTNSGSYANATYADDQGSNVWRLPLQVTAFDDAGNRAITTGYLDLDPDSDKPVVSVVAPSDEASVSGTFLVNGTILDDDGTDYVNLQFDFDDDGLFDDAGDSDAGALLSISNDLNGNTIADDTIDESTPITLSASTGSWAIALSASDFSIVNLGNAGYTSSGYIRIRLTPYDINGLAGDSETVRIYLDTNSPVISGLDATGTVETDEPTPLTGTIQKSNITIRARFEDDKELLSSGMRISFDGGATFQLISSLAGYSITDESAGSVYKYYASIPVDTTTAVTDGNGVLSIQISVTDQTNKQSTKSLQYNVDNDLPVIQWNEDGSGTLQDLPFIGTPPNEIYTFKGNSSTGEADDAYKVIGAAVDSGTISGIEKVNVYFVKDVSGTLYFYKPTLTVGSDPHAERLAIGAEVQVHDENGTLVSIPFIENDTPANSEYVITVDNRIEQGLFDQTDDIGDKDGYQESLKAKAGYDEWYAYFDTTQLPDGPIYIYSVVYDEAGNTSYTVADAQIANNPPTIPTILVGSTTINDSNIMAKASGDIVFTINTADAENIDVDTLTMEIVTRYVVDSGLGAEDTDFDPALFSNTSYVYTDFDTRPVGDAQTAQFIETFVSDNGTAGDASDDPLGSNFYYEYLVQVNDSDGNLVTRTFYLWINNADEAAPTVTIDEFTQDSVSGGGGHLEERVNSPNDAADHDGINDADLSGMVTVSGTAYDDTQVSSLTVEYSPDNGLNWYIAGAASVSAGVGDDTNGYDYTWTFDWNTESLTSDGSTVIAALEDVLIRAYGTDGTNVTPESGAGQRPQVTVDVVPYITDITGAGFDSGLLTYVRRSAAGRYPVSTDSSITIEGYNLPVDEAGSVGFGTTVVDPASVGSYSGSGSVSSISVNLTGETTAGELFVLTNGVISLNNINNNNLEQNQEPSLYNSTLTDDREVVLWNVAGIAGTSTITDPVMHPNPTGSGFDWMYVRSGKELYYYDPDAVLPNTTEKLLTEGLSLKGGPFTYNGSGSLIFMFNHTSEWTPWDGSFAFTGSAQFGQILSPTAYSFTANRDEAYNWNQNTTFAKLGVGNVNFGYTTNNESELPAILQYGTYSPDTGYLNMDLNRFENLTIRTVGDDSMTRNYAAYFDTGAGESRSIVFYAFQTSDTSVTATENVYSNSSLAASADAGGGIVANIDKFTNSVDDNDVALAGTQKNNNNGIATPRGRQEVTAVNSEEDSAYFDLGVYEAAADAHYGFIAYFDEQNQNLKITVNEDLYTADPTGSLGTWSSPVTIDSDAGAYVSMAIDDDGGIHLAYQDVGGYLKYAYLTYTSGSGFDIDGLVIVDGLLGAGANNDIEIRNFGTVPAPEYRPVIMTFSSAFSGTRAPLRMSYPLFEPASITVPANFPAGAGEDGAFTGNWETIALPADSAPENAEAFLYMDSSGRPHLGYKGSTLEEASFLGF